MGETDDGGFGHVLMRHERAFDFGGAETVARHINHIVDAAGDPIVAVLVAATSVTGEIFSRIGFEVGVDEALMIAVDRAHLAGP